MAEILNGAEKALATLASKATNESDYDAASCLIELARELNRLASKARGQLDDSIGEPPRPSSTSNQNRKEAQRTAPRQQIRSKQKYPRFLRDGSNLIKIGWSPSLKAEYEQKSPERVLDLLAESISRVGANGKRFAMDKVLPLTDARDGTKVPDYQAYLWLAWLRTLDLLVQHGRQGYSLATRAPLEPLIATHWERLASR